MTRQRQLDLERHQDDLRKLQEESEERYNVLLKMHKDEIKKIRKENAKRMADMELVVTLKSRIMALEAMNDKRDVTIKVDRLIELNQQRHFDYLIELKQIEYRDRLMARERELEKKAATKGIVDKMT